MAITHDEGPNYEVEIDAAELLADLAEEAAKYGEKYEEKRRWWFDSFDAATELHDARYWMLEARGGQHAYSMAIAALQPGETWQSDRFRNDDGTVDVRAFMAWVSDAASEAHESSYGAYTETRHADEAETAYTCILSTLRDDYGVGWPRMDDLGGNALPEDLP